MEDDRSITLAFSLAARGRRPQGDQQDQAQDIGNDERQDAIENGGDLGILNDDFDGENIHAYGRMDQPSSTVTTMMIPNQIGSKPSSLMTGKIIGTVRMIMASPSIRQPSTKYMSTINASMPYLAESQPGQNAPPIVSAFLFAVGAASPGIHAQAVVKENSRS